MYQGASTLGLDEASGEGVPATRQVRVVGSAVRHIAVVLLDLNRAVGIGEFQPRTLRAAAVVIRHGPADQNARRRVHRRHEVFWKFDVTFEKTNVGAH